MISEEHYAETYTIEAVSVLCQMADIEPTDTGYVRAELEHFAAIYRWQHSKTVGKIPSKTTARELDTVANQAARLLGALEKLSPAAAAAIEGEAATDTQTGLTHATSGMQASPSLFLSLQDVTDEIIGVTVDTVTLRTVIGGLHHAAQNASEGIPKSSSSKAKDLELLLWLSNIQRLWSGLTGQPFSRDIAPDGDPITNAGRFCLMAFKMIEPDCAPSRVMNGMKTRSKNRRKSTGNLRA